MFVRTDIPLAHQIVQSNHAVYHLAGLRYEDGNPNLVVIGLPSESSLRRTLRKLETHQIPHYAWTEPDNNFGLTAIATAPLRGEERKILANYRLYAPVAQQKERRVLSAEDVGSIPTGGANRGGAEASARA